jgi:hypothetical protein
LEKDDAREGQTLREGRRTLAILIGMAQGEVDDGVGGSVGFTADDVRRRRESEEGQEAKGHNEIIHVGERER